MTSVALLSLDFGDARWGIARDIDEIRSIGLFGWFLLGTLFALPVASIAALARRRTLALIPLTISGFVLAMWFLYYATDWFTNPGQGGFTPFFLLLLAGWGILAIAVRRPKRPKPFQEPR